MTPEVMTSKHVVSPARGWLPLGLLAGACALHLAEAATFPEPSTVFYGRITGVGSAQPFPITQGTLEWVVEAADGSLIRSSAPIRPLKDSAFSYRLNVPHHVLAEGANATSPGSLALKGVRERHRHLEIRVNGVPAVIAGASGETFDAAQASRAATFALDLEVPIAPPDSDGDGLPDWWQTLHQITGGAAGDADGDGVRNGDEYRLGTNPKRSNGEPSLRTSTILTYADGVTGVTLDAADADSSAEQLIYTLTSVPEAGSLRLRNATASTTQPDLTLAAGARFTQADVLQGRLIYVHDGVAALRSTAFSVTLSDGTPGIASAPKTVELRPYRPAVVTGPGEPPLPVLPAGVELMSTGTTTASAQREQNYALSRDAGFVIWDWSGSPAGVRFQAPSAGRSVEEYAGQHGAERGHVVAGGLGANWLEGGVDRDVLIAGPLSNALRGHQGADRFVMGAGSGGIDEVLDFRPEEGDVLDFSRLLSGSSGLLSDYVRVEADGSSVVLRIDASGRRGSFSDRQVRLTGWAISGVDLSAWLDGGHLLTGGIGLPPRISISATRAMTGESESEPAEVILTRTGSLASSLEVALTIGGAAINGVDFSALSSRVLFAAGERTHRLLIQPFADGQPESDEIVEIRVSPGAEYAVAAKDRVQVTIADWRSTISVVALDSFATLQPFKSGAIRIVSSAPVDRPVEVVLRLAGTAEAGVHYQPIRRSVLLGVGQSSATVDVIPVAGSLPPNGVVVLEVGIEADAAYRMGGSRSARITVVNQLETFAAWRQRHFPGNTEALGVFGARDPEGAGVPMLARYAFGMDPKQPDAAGIPRPRLRDGYLTLDVPRRAAAGDLSYIVEVSQDLVNWETSSTRIEEIAAPGGGVDPALLCVRALPAVAEAPRQFIRVRVALRP